MKPSKPLTRKTFIRSKPDKKPSLKLSLKPAPLISDESPKIRKNKPFQALQKQTLKALNKAKSEANKSGVELSEWEDSFINDVSDRVLNYGRAFQDPDKGAQGSTLSLLQGLKFKEIRRKIKTKAKDKDKLNSSPNDISEDQ